MTTPEAPPLLFCGDGCRRSLVDEQAAMDSGWTFLAVLNRWRCPVCVRELAAARDAVGAAPTDFVDQLASDSRGALPKATADTIAPPVVRP